MFIKTDLFYLNYSNFLKKYGVPREKGTLANLVVN